MKEVEVPGGKASFRERGVDEIPGRARKLIRAAALSAGTVLPPEFLEDARKGETDEERAARLRPLMQLSPLQMEFWDNMREAAAVGMLARWTLDRPLPTLATIGDLPEDLYDALLDAVGGVSAADLQENFEGSDPKAPGYKETPTTDSSGSEWPSEAAQPKESTSTPPSGTPPTNGASSSPEPSSRTRSSSTKSTSTPPTGT